MHSAVVPIRSKPRSMRSGPRPIRRLLEHRRFIRWCSALAKHSTANGVAQPDGRCGRFPATKDQPITTTAPKTPRHSNKRSRPSSKSVVGGDAGTIATCEDGCYAKGCPGGRVCYQNSCRANPCATKTCPSQYWSCRRFYTKRHKATRSVDACRSPCPRPRAAIAASAWAIRAAPVPSWPKVPADPRQQLQFFVRRRAALQKHHLPPGWGCLPGKPMASAWR